MNFGQSTENKSKFLFNEVTTLTGVKPYVLRFWESEFHQINPELDQNEKFYDPNDVKVISLIKKLLFEDKLSIPEVKGILDDKIHAMNNEVELEPILEEGEQEVCLSFNSDEVDLAGFDNIIASKAKLNELSNLIESIEKKHCWI